MPLASPPAEPCFELNEVYFRRAWGMTAKDGAFSDSPGRWRVPMLFVAGNKAPRDSGNHTDEKHGEAASALR